MKKNPLIEKLAVQSLVDYNGELIFSKEKFAELIIKECIDSAIWVGKSNKNPVEPIHTAMAIKKRIEQRFENA